MNELIQAGAAYFTEILMILVVAFATWALNAVREHFGISAENEVFKALDTEIERAVNVGADHLMKTFGKLPDFDTRHEWINESAAVLARQAPKTLKRSGLTPDQVAERIEGALYGRLGKTS